MYFFDSNCMIGHNNLLSGERTDVQTTSFYRTERLLKEMDYHGISEALIFHAVCMEHSPQIGNMLTLRETKKSPRLHPVWCLLPSKMRKTSNVEETIEKMKKSDARIVRLFPSIFKFYLAEWCMGNTFDILSQHHIPVILDYWQSKQNWQSIYNLCQKNPGLCIILTKFRFNNNRNILQLMNKCPNLHLEISSLWSPFRIIEFLCNEYGAERLFFGTRMPLMNPAARIGVISYSMISDDEKALIAGQNLKRLMENVCFG